MRSPTVTGDWDLTHVHSAIDRDHDRDCVYKVPELFRANQGFWYMVSDARTDFAVFCCLVFLISVGGGSLSPDARLAKHNRNGG